MTLPSFLRKKLYKKIRFLYTVISLALIIYFSWLNWPLIDRMMQVADLTLLLFSVLLWSSLHLLSPIISKIIFSSIGPPLSYKNLLNIYMSRLPGRYLPGGIWHTVGRLSDYYSLGISKTKLTSLTVIEAIFPCLITLSTGGAYLYLTGEKSFFFSIEGLIAFISMLVMISFPVFLKIYFSPNLSKKFVFYYLSLILFSLIFWGVASLSFFHYYDSISLEGSKLSVFRVSAIYVFSWGIGYLSIFAPQGLGVFEVIAGKLMVMPMSLGGTIAFLMGFRLISLMADCLALSVYYTLRLFFKYKMPQIT